MSRINFFIFCCLILGAFIVGVTSVPLSECVDGQTKKNSCNNCVCDNGQWKCTHTACPGAHSLNIRSQILDANTPRRYEQCVRGQIKTNLCKSCICITGIWECTRHYYENCSSGHPNPIDFYPTTPRFDKHITSLPLTTEQLEYRYIRRWQQGLKIVNNTVIID